MCHSHGSPQKFSAACDAAHDAQLKSNNQWLCATQSSSFGQLITSAPTQVSKIVRVRLIPKPDVIKWSGRRVHAVLHEL
ncbi:hypothetical protein Q5P01_013660 [Channa striata]|uniref:Uncharacterized protein n=1 Tax=Channa striata TaxID=64152 RepID=A0AA88MMS9_CHASR|nr:hypothetical protein Q5P01_013660 [Channa striata]